MNDPNFLNDINAIVSDEIVESIVIAPFDRYGHDSKKNIPTYLLNTVQKWDDVKEYLNYDYDDGFGGADCHSIMLWTPTRVIFVHEYDGATGLHFVYRNPTDCNPDYSGQSE